MKKLYNFLVVLFISAYAFNCASAQSLKIYDVNANNYPDIKARMKLIDLNDHEVRNMNINDFIVTENSVQRTIKSVSCGEEVNNGMLSVVLVIDRSASMLSFIDPDNTVRHTKWEIAHESAKSLINSLPADSSECAILAFSGTVELMHGFSNNKRDLIDSLDKITLFGSTDYNAALLSGRAGNQTGALYLAKKARFKPVIIFITDGLHDRNTSGDLHIHDIVDSAKMIYASIYSVTLDLNSPDELKFISDSTHGKWYSNLKTMDNTKFVLNEIITIAKSKGYIPYCEIVWESDCNGGKTRLDCVRDEAQLSKDINYVIPDSVLPVIELEPDSLTFVSVVPGSYQEMDVNISARKNYIDITGFNSTDPRFTISDWDGTPFRLNKDESRTFKVKYTSTDSSFVTATMNIPSSACNSISLNVSSAGLIFGDIDMDTAAVGINKVRSFEISNKTGIALNIKSTYFKDRDFTDFRIISLSPSIIPNGTSAFISVQFEPKKSGRSESNLCIDTDKGTFRSKIYGYASDETGVDEETKNLGLISINPNPAIGLIEIKFITTGQGQAKIRITDYLGNVVSDLPVSDYEPGPHSLIFDAGQLPAGVYYLTIKTASSINSNKFSVIR